MSQCFPDFSWSRDRNLNWKDSFLDSETECVVSCPDHPEGRYPKSRPIPIPNRASSRSSSDPSPPLPHSPHLFVPLEQQPCSDETQYVLISGTRGIVFRRIPGSDLYQALRKGTPFVLEEKGGVVRIRGVWCNGSLRSLTPPEKREAQTLGIPM